MARKFYAIMRLQRNVETLHGISEVAAGQRVMPVFESREEAEFAARNFEEIIEMEEIDPRIDILDDMISEVEEALENLK